MRYFLHLAYDGTSFHGWQVQPNARSVQEDLTQVLRTYFRQPELDIVGCGRTDTGVHASSYYAHFDLAEEASDNAVYRLNQMLPDAIAIFDLIAVGDDAHARFDATARTYHYFLHQHKDPFKVNRSAYFKRPLDLEAMNEAASVLADYSDFAAFSKSGTDVKTTICRIDEAHWRTIDGSLCFTITADRFLRNMVRAIVGTLMEVGLGRIDIKGFRQIIESKDRREAGISAPACGLYLAQIRYPYLTA